MDKYDSTYLGGTGYDKGYGITIDSSDCAYIGGQTQSPNFPTTPGAFDTSLDGTDEAFVVKLNPSGNALEYSTLLGEAGYTYSAGITLDSCRCIYIVGYTTSPDFPTTPDAFDRSPNGSPDGFMVKLDLRPEKTDLLIKAGIESSYSGQDVFDAHGTNQTKSMGAAPGQKITYAFKVRNAGDVSNSFKITAPAGGSGWNVRYYDLTNGAEVTSQVTGVGWSSGTLAPGASKGIFVTVKPDATVPAGSGNTLLITAASEADDSKIDVVKAVTSFSANYKTDMLIKSGTETSYGGTGVFNTDGANQTKTQNVSPNQKVTCAFRARNAGTASDSFRITGTSGGNGWSVKYYDLTTNVDVTSQVMGAGWVSNTLAPGVSSGVYANIKPDTSVSLGSPITLIVTGSSEADNMKIDVVKSVVTCVASYKADLLLKTGSEASYTGTGIINTDGTDQTKSQNTSAGQKLTYAFRVKNAGTLNDSFTITGPAGGSGWSVKYYDLSTNAEVTSQVTGAGWLSGTISPGTDKGVYAKVSPDATVASGSSKALVIIAASVGDSAKQDVVKAVTTVP
ncbi:MAG: SBBP repeat-containing protein [Armatimonadota bacterium]